MVTTQLIRSDERYHKDAGWLQARWHFAFADYHDPDNVSFGPLRVFNDDVVKPGTGFGLHPHKDMEIITYVIAGRLEHQDHLGNRGVVHAGEVQVMSAGKGIFHGERNPSKTDDVRLLQIWIMPRTTGGAPRWEQKQFTPADRAGKLLPVVSPGDAAKEGTLAIDQDATVYVSSLKEGESVNHETKPGRLTYLFVITGAAQAEEEGTVTLNGGDQLRIADPMDLKLTATEATEVMLIDLPAT